MINHVSSIEFFVEIGIAALIAVILLLLVRFYNKKHEGKEVEFGTDFIKVPIYNTLLVLSFLLPALVGLAIALYQRNPDGRYSFLISAICIFFIILAVAIWGTFSSIYKFIRKGNPNDTIKLKWPEDSYLLTGFSLIYGFLMLGLIYFFAFFLFELTPLVKPSLPVAVSKFASSVALQKPAPYLGQSKTQIINSWGEPSAYLNPSKDIAKYDANGMVIVLYFNDTGVLNKIVQSIKLEDRR